MLTKEQLIKMNIDRKWLKPLNSILDIYVDEDKITVAMFLAECSHESKNFTRLEESFNYTTERLFEVFKQRVKTIEKARELVSGGKQAIANFVYNGRMGNSYGSNDGFSFRGRGIIQLTGRDNYKKYGKILNIDLVNNPDLALELNNACLIAGAYWKINGCNELSKKNDFKGVTKVINGGYNGLEDREKLYKKYLAVIDGNKRN